MTQTSYTWTRDMIPGDILVRDVGERREGPEVRMKSNTLTVTLPVDTAPAALVVWVTGQTSSTCRPLLARVADDDYPGCTYRVFVDGVLANVEDRRARGDVLRLAPATGLIPVTLLPTFPRPQERVGAERRGDGEHGAGQRHDRAHRAGQPVRVRLRKQDVALLGATTSTRSRRSSTRCA